MCYVHVRLLGPLLLLVFLRHGDRAAWTYLDLVLVLYSGALKCLPTGFTSRYEECLWFMYQHASLRSFFFEEPVPIQCHTPAVLLAVITSTWVTKVRRWLRQLGFGPSGDQFVLLGGQKVFSFGWYLAQRWFASKECTQTCFGRNGPYGLFPCSNRVLFEMTQAIWTAHSTYGTCTQWFTAMHVEIT